MIGMCNNWYLCPLEGKCLFVNKNGEEVPEFGLQHCMLGINLFVKKDEKVIVGFTESALKIKEEMGNK